MADDVRKYRAEGYRRFQLKVGADPDEDVRLSPMRLVVVTVLWAAIMIAPPVGGQPFLYFQF